MKTFSFFLLLILFSLLNAQETFDLYPDSLFGGGTIEPIPSRHRVGMGYFGETYVHPGMAFYYIHSLKHEVKTKTKKNGKLRLKIYELAWDNKLVFYNHKRNHTGLLIAPGITGTRMSKKGGFISLNIFSGLLHAFLNEDTYEVGVSGEINKVRAPGNAAFAVGFGTRIGKDLSMVMANFPFSVFIGSNVIFTTPYNTRSVWKIAIEVGLIYELKSNE